MKHLADFKISDRNAVLSNIQIGSYVEGFSFGWRGGSLHSVGKYKGDTVAYIKHEDNIIMYFASKIRVPDEVTQFLI